MLESLMKTFSLKESEVKNNWVLFDATGISMGRLATSVAQILKGKHKVEYCPHMACGDFVDCYKYRKAF